MRATFKFSNVPIVRWYNAPTNNRWQRVLTRNMDSKMFRYYAGALRIIKTYSYDTALAWGS
jgi:hypothetical protein